MDEWKVGDVVVLKSGGPKMTVVGIPIDPTIGIVCAWMDQYVATEHYFPAACLREPTPQDEWEQIAKVKS